MSVIQMPVNKSSKNDESSYDYDYLIRQTHYLTGKLICAIEKITKVEHSKKDAVLRDLLSSAIEEKYPGLLEEVADEGAALEKRQHDRLSKKLGLEDDSSSHHNPNKAKSAFKIQPKPKK